MKAGDLQIQLATWNPWWRPGDWKRDDTRLRSAAASPFSYRAGCLDDLRPGGLYVLRGPRRAGKSTEIKYAIADLLDGGVDPRSIVHAAVDGWRADDLRRMIGTASTTFLTGTRGPRHWFIDEISSVTGDWPNTIKNLRDNDPAFSTDTVVLTGSSSARLHEARKALAGRRGDATDSDRTLLPMGYADIVRAAGVDLPSIPRVRVRDLRTPDVRALVSELLPYVSDLVPLWESYLRTGGFPQAVASWQRHGDVTPEFTDALWDVVFGDAISGSRLTAAQTETLLARLATNLCSPLNVSDLGRELDVAPHTASERLADLAEHFLAWQCHAEQGLTPKLNAQSKWYFTDPLLARLAGLRRGGREPDLTQLSQQQIGLALLRSLDTDGTADIADPGTVLHYRSATRAEIDFVSRRFGEIAVESKYVDDRWGRELQTIARSPWFGIVATRSGLEWGDDAWVMPAPILVLLLGG